MIARDTHPPLVPPSLAASSLPLSLSHRPLRPPPSLAGIRKQSCLERKCRQPTAAPVPGGPSSNAVHPNIAGVVAAVGLAKAAAGASGCMPCGPDGESKPGMPPAMPPQEWDAFWGAVECCMLLQAGASGTIDGEYAAGAKRARTNRCGTCIGCTRGDCGTCKNCRDKPKFGGPGVKKQACVRRTCNNPLAERDDDEEEDDDEEGSVREGAYEQPQMRVDATTAPPVAEGVGGFMSGEPSPSSQPTEGAAVPPAWELPQAALGEKAARSRPGPKEKKSGMMDETRRRLQELRALATTDGADDADAGSGGRASSLSMGYSTADEEVADDVDDEDDAESGAATEEGHEDAASSLAESAALSRAATVTASTAAAPIAAERFAVRGAAMPVSMPMPMPMVTAPMPVPVVRYTTMPPIAAAPVAAAPVAAAPVAAAPVPAAPVTAAPVVTVATSVVGKPVMASAPSAEPTMSVAIARTVRAATAAAAAPAPAVLVASRPAGAERQ